MLGIFDSGLGGLTALKEIHKKMPSEELVYFGDTGRVPYGTRSRSTIVNYALQDMRFLLEFKPRAVVAACGTVSTTSLDVLRSTFDIPIIGVVEGAAEAAVKATKNGKIAVIGTTATIRSGAFEREIRSLSPEIEVIGRDCPLFVPLVENGFVGEDDPITRLACEHYLAPIAESGADVLILGCTHYPIIADAIGKTLPGVKLISTGAEAARKVAEVLGTTENSDHAEGTIRYFVSDDTALFNATASLFLGEDVRGSVERVTLG